MLKETFIRQCAHNLHERNTVRKLKNEKGCSYPRRQFLQSQLNRLEREKKFFESIKHEFNIKPSDCFRL